MAIYIAASQELKVDNLRELQNKVSLKGGRLIVYCEVISALFLSARSYRVRWIADSSERKSAGAISSAITCLLGWWSIPGPYWSISALICNLRGGFDVTEGLMKAHPGNTSLLEYSDARALADYREECPRRARNICFGLVGCFVIFVVYLVWSSGG